MHTSVTGPIQTDKKPPVFVTPMMLKSKVYSHLPSDMQLRGLSSFTKRRVDFFQ